MANQMLGPPFKAYIITCYETAYYAHITSCYLQIDKINHLEKERDGKANKISQLKIIHLKDKRKKFAE